MDTKKVNNTVVSSGMDWITITSGTMAYSDTIQRQGSFIIDTEEGMGGIPKKWGMQGYRGVSCGGVKVGVRGQDEAILILTGQAADTYRTKLDVVPDRIRRLDLQVSVRLREPQSDIARVLYKKLEQVKEDGGLRAKLRFIESETGSTLYVGRRGRGKMLRFYDKSLDYGESARGYVWRYEVEYGRQVAQKAWNAVDQGEHYESTIASLVASEYNSRQVSPLFAGYSTVTAIEVGQQISDAEGQLNWLARCVSPCLVRLAEAGHIEQVFEALSLQALIDRKEANSWHSSKPTTQSGPLPIRTRETRYRRASTID